MKEQLVQTTCGQINCCKKRLNKSVCNADDEMHALCKNLIPSKLKKKIHFLILYQLSCIRCLFSHKYTSKSSKNYPNYQLECPGASLKELFHCYWYSLYTDFNSHKPLHWAQFHLFLITLTIKIMAVSENNLYTLH